jgi:hypothetical protein
MATLALSIARLEALGLSADDISEPLLSDEAKQALAAVLVGYGFDLTRPVHVVALVRSGEGFLLTQ